MRLTAVLVLTTCLQLCAWDTYGQQKQTVTLAHKGASLETVIIDIRNQTGYNFLYDTEWLQYSKPVTVDLKDTYINIALDSCFKNQPFTYAVTGSIITIISKNVPLPTSPPKTFAGKVTTSDGVPLQGATILIKGTTIGTSTDANGIFLLSQVEKNAVLEVSYVGYHSQLIKVGKKDIDVRLEANPKSMETIVTKGFYFKTLRKYDLGNSGKISGEEISRTPVTNIMSLFAGRIPGMIGIEGSGYPGSKFKVQIRGQKSIGTIPGRLPANSPVFIIDGVPFLNGDESIVQSQSYIGGNPFSTINPADIESIEVLKDANATAIYGSLGANGVVVITTRRPKIGKTSVDVRMTTGWSKIANSLDYLNTEQYLKMRHEALDNDGEPFNAQTAPDLFLWDTTRYTNWKKDLIGGTANLSNAHIRLSGGTENTQFTASAGYIKESTVLPGNFSKSLVSLNLQVSHISDNKKLEFLMANSYGWDKSNLLTSDPAGSIGYISPNAPKPFDNNGKLIWEENTLPYGNPFSYLLQPYGVSMIRLTSSMKINYRLFKWLQIRSNIGYTNLTADEYGIVPIASQDPDQNPTGSAAFGNSKNRNWIVEPQLESTVGIGERINQTERIGKLKMLIGTSFREQISTSHADKGYKYTSDALLKSLSGANQIVSESSNTLYRVHSVYGLINYIHNDKYLVELTARTDGSSRFGPKKQFGNFGSIAAGWIFSNENFIKKTFPFLSFGKIRMSYGSTGNDQIENYRYLDGWVNSPYGYPTQAVAYKPQNLYNNDFKWEVHKSTDITLDLGFAKNRILVTATLNRTSTSNQLLLYQLASQAGFNSVIKNSPGKVGNKNFELELNTINFRGKDFKWTTSASLTISRNKLLSFPALPTSEYRLIYIEGQSLNLGWGYRTAGVDPVTGLYQFYDKDGKLVDIAAGGTLNDSDLVKINTFDPTYYAGIQNSFQYKNWRLDVLLQIVKQRGYNNLAIKAANAGFGLVNVPVALLNRWQHSGDRATYQQYSQGAVAASEAAYYYSQSDALATTGSYLRFKTISLSYSLPYSWIEKLKMKSCSLSFQAQNLFTITRYKGGHDPESAAVQYMVLPPLRTFAISIQASL